MSTSATKSVVIVGGGVAGLACGSLLASRPGFKVTLLEATDGIGGRVKTAAFGSGGGHVELGAQWIHGENGNSVFQLLQPYDVLEDEETELYAVRSMFVTQKGEFLPDKVKDKVTEVMEELQVDACKSLGVKHNESLGNYAESLFWKLHDQSPLHLKKSICDGVLDWIHRFQNSIDGAESWFSTSFRGQLEYTHCDGNPTIEWKPPASYATLLDILVHGKTNAGAHERLVGLPDWIHLRQRVKTIRYGGNDANAVVECQDGTNYDADYVVITVSLGVLKQKHTKMFVPALPLEKVKAIEHLGFGVVDKIFLEFDSAWWPQKSLGFSFVWDDCSKINDNWTSNVKPSILSQVDENGIPRWCRSLLGFYTLKSQPKMLYTWITGPPAEFMESLDLDTLEEYLMKVLQKFVGSVFCVPKPVGVMRSTWKSNTMTRGSYSFRTVGSEENGVCAMDLAQPILNSKKKPIVCFAGEATHPKFYSTVHGAYDTGLREARRILSHSSESVNLAQTPAAEDDEDEGGFCCSLMDYV